MPVAIWPLMLMLVQIGAAAAVDVAYFVVVDLSFVVVMAGADLNNYLKVII